MANPLETMSPSFDPLMTQSHYAEVVQAKSEQPVDHQHNFSPAAQGRDVVNASNGFPDSNSGSGSSNDDDFDSATSSLNIDAKAQTSDTDTSQSNQDSSCRNDDD